MLELAVVAFTRLIITFAVASRKNNTSHDQKARLASMVKRAFYNCPY